MKLNITYRRSKMAQLVNGQADDCCAALFSCSWDVGNGLCIYTHTLLCEYVMSAVLQVQHQWITPVYTLRLVPVLT